VTKSKDPICGMTVENERAAARSDGPDGTVYFCSVGCKLKYDMQHPAGK
jgi:YHS domain-containing protein